MEPEHQMEKQGIIKPGVTPPERDDQKTASELEECSAKRLADSVKDALK